MGEFDIKPLGSRWQSALQHLSQAIQVNNNSKAFVMHREPDFFRLLRYQGQNSVVLGACRQDILLGSVTVHFDELYIDKERRSCAYIADLKVSLEERGKGMASKLVAAATEAAHAAGHHLVLSVVAADNTGALRTFAHLQKLKDFKAYYFPVLWDGRPQQLPLGWAWHVYGEVPSALKGKMDELWRQQAPSRQGARHYAEGFMEAHHFPDAQHWLVLRAGDEVKGFWGLWDQRGSRQVRVPNQHPMIQRWLYASRSNDATASLALLSGIHLCWPANVYRYFPQLIQQAIQFCRQNQMRIFCFTLDDQDPLTEAFPRAWFQTNDLLLLGSESLHKPLPFAAEFGLG